MKTKLFTTVLVILFSAFMLAAANTAKGKESRFASSLENAMDPAVKVENWMFNDAFWNIESAVHFSSDYDESLPLENWMSSINGWNAYALGISETEENLEMESWMINDILWASEAELTDAEEALVLEDWMVSADLWINDVLYAQASDEKLEMESWMTDEKYWNLPEGR